jgi:CSLREA domain-containing protein
MFSIVAAAAVTLVVNTAEDKVSASDGKLSLREAITAANQSLQPHVITFTGAGLGYHAMESALEVRTRAALTIDGDVNNDGLADVTLYRSFAEKLIIRQGADVTIIGVDLWGGSGAGNPGSPGVRGVDGAQGLAGEPGRYTGPTTPPTLPTDGKPGGNGKPGTNGARGENVAGIIHNFGKLHLVRLGLADGYAIAGVGGDGGPGGWGGHGGGGGDGLGSGDEFWSDDAFVPQKGASGARSGNGARGGDGGDGGNAAGAILNEATGQLTLTDVTFGGRLGGWLVEEGSKAIAQRGGRFGPGGDGREGGTGGGGGDQGYVRSIAVQFAWDPPGPTLVNSAWLRYSRTSLGQGGNGGNGGSRGADGRFGRAGDAASAVLNLGVIRGAAAVGRLGEATGGLAQTNNPQPYTNGDAGLGGNIGARRVATFSHCPDIAFYSNPDFTAAAMAVAPSDHRLNLPPSEGRLPSPGRSPSSAIPGQDAVRAASVTAGRSVLGILNSGQGTGSVAAAPSLAFVHPLGVRVQNGLRRLEFNIVRLGRGNQPVTVSWAILPATAGPSVSPADFGTAALPSGRVTLPRLPADAVSDIEDSVRLVSIPIRRDSIDEPPEGFRMRLTSVSTNQVLLGTRLVQGKIVDGSP